MLSSISPNEIYTLLIFALWAASELLGPVRWSKSRGSKGQKRDRGSLAVGSVFGVSGVVLAFLAPMLLPAASIPGQTLLLSSAGIVVVSLGIAWRWYAILTLGRYFTAAVIIQQQQPVVQHGPYRFIRHPSYGGVLVIVVGIGLMTGNWVSLCAITTSFLISVLYRIPIEEQELQRSLEKYEEYMQRTKRLIPFIY